MDNCEIKEEVVETSLSNKKQIAIIVICWISYVLALLGRYSYSSNVTLIMEKFSVEHAVASLPATLFFFAYGLGQILVGFVCHRYNRRLLIIIALVTSGIINVIIYAGIEFNIIKYLWLLNGLAQANLWPVFLLILRENISKKNIGIVTVVMATASTGGKFAAIGICAIFAINTSMFMYCFLTAGIISISAAILFFSFTKGIKKPGKEERLLFRKRIAPKEKIDKRSVVLLLLFFEFSLVSYAISGGLQSWVPAILKECYNLSDSLSIFMSVMLPLFSLSVAVISPVLIKLLKNHIFISLLCFVVGALLIVLVYVFLNVNWVLVITLFTIEAIVMGIVSNTTTVQIPLTFEGKFDAGFLAGFLNGACYIGTSIATYVLGAMADKGGWTYAFSSLIVIAIISALLALIYLIFTKSKKKENSVSE